MTTNKTANAATAAANAVPAAVKQSFLKRILPYLVGGTATAGTMDTITYKGDYSDMNTGRLANTGLNFMLGALGGKQIAQGNGVTGLTEISLAPMKDFYLKGTETMDDAQKALQAVTEKIQSPDKPLSFWQKLSPTEKTLIASGLLVGGVATVPALFNISRAADRLADGRAVRLSTSIRKRPLQESDLTIGIKNLTPPEDPDQLSQEQMAQSEQQKPKGFFSRLFGN